MTPTEVETLHAPVDAAPRPAECATVAPLLSDLAAQIRAEHQAVVSTLRRSLAHALACGRLLIEAHTAKDAQGRALVPHGQWQQFVEDCGLSYRTAARYCQLASSFDALPADQQEEAARLPTMERALRYLMGPPEPELAPQQYQVGPAFVSALKACSKFIAGAEDSRETLKGIHLVAGGRIIRMEATDGHRMFNTAVQFEHEIPAADVVVPADLGSRGAALFRSGQPVTMAIAEHEVALYTKDAKVVGRLIEAKYVEFEKHMTKILANPRAAVVNVGRLAEAIEIAQIAAQDIPTQPVLLRFGQHQEPDTLLVTDDAGTETEIEGVAWEGEAFTIKLNSDYVLNFLAQFPVTNDVTLRFDSELSPMGIIGADGRCGAILPLRQFENVRPAAVDAATTAMAEPPRPESVSGVDPKLDYVPKPEDAPEKILSWWCQRTRQRVVYRVGNVFGLAGDSNKVTFTGLNVSANGAVYRTAVQNLCLDPTELRAIADALDLSVETPVTGEVLAETAP